jgi:hypothetical protein
MAGAAAGPPAEAEAEAEAGADAGADADPLAHAVARARTAPVAQRAGKRRNTVIDTVLLTRGIDSGAVTDFPLNSDITVTGDY